jgi:hypothetical protein
MMPSRQEWDTSHLPEERQGHLEAGLSFEEIIAEIVADAVVQSATIKTYRDPPKEPKGAKEARQVCFVLGVQPRSCDLLYNSRDGLRARYWQSPDIGFHATRHMLNALAPKLIAYCGDRAPTVERYARPMALEEIPASLAALSAKAWPSETDVNGQRSTPTDDPHQVIVPRWAQNETLPGSRGDLWRWCPTDRDLDIKGALLDPTGREHIPEGKRDRSCQIHHYGFT